jgi:hypothetical protein
MKEELESTDDLWDRFLPYAESTSNIMRPWRPDPSLSAYSSLHRLPYDFSAHPVYHPGQLCLAFSGPEHHDTWAPHGDRAFTLGPPFHLDDTAETEVEVVEDPSDQVRAVESGGGTSDSETPRPTFLTHPRKPQTKQKNKQTLVRASRLLQSNQSFTLPTSLTHNPQCFPPRLLPAHTRGGCVCGRSGVFCRFWRWASVS